MFPTQIYTERRRKLKEDINSGLILLPGNQDVAFNYPANIYTFRQDSTFLYFFGIDQPSLTGIIDADTGEEIIFGDELTIDDIIWMGSLPTIKEQAEKVGISKTLPLAKLQEYITNAVLKGRKVHFLPAYRQLTKFQLGTLFGFKCPSVNNFKSVELIKAVVKLRSYKDKYEIADMEKMVDVAYLMHTTAMKMAKPGVIEREIAGKLQGISLANGGPTSFPPIVTINGQTLHNNYYGNTLKEGRMLVADVGSESVMHYASDITRTTPVGGKFNPRQKDIYEIVLKANLEAIKDIEIGKEYRKTHLLSAKIIAQGLTDLGIMKGNVDDAVVAGAHALFYPHGLGHMLGLDVHDMEGLGEDYVGYNDEIKRASQFGLAGLRLGRKLEKDFTLTVEPGCYFIPDLIDIWKSENKHSEFINYNKVEQYKDFGGIRLEDDILVTENGAKVLGKPIPKTVAEIEEICK